MSATDQVVNAACIISVQNKTPSIALLKSRLGSSVPIPTLIQGLQRFKSMDRNERASLIQQISQQVSPPLSTPPLTSASDKEESNLNIELQKLQAQVQQLITTNTDLENRIQKLELEQKKEHK
ncbi:MAG: hypothetical protein HAW66_02990 [Shewanella sp.]|nr:hypothetical protein [Shewanella sp.]